MALIMALIRLWGFRIAGTLCVLAFLFWSACYLFVPTALKNAVEEYGQKIGYEISYRDLSLSPLRLRIEVDGLHIADARHQQLLDLEKFVVMLKWSRLVRGELGFDEVFLDQPQWHLEKLTAKGEVPQWNWQAFISAVNQSLPPPDASEPNSKLKSKLKISVDEFRVSNASLTLIDSLTQLNEKFKPLSIELLDIANYDRHGDVNGVRGQYGLNLGALQFTLPYLNKKIAFKRVAIQGSLDNSVAETMGAQIDLEIDDGLIQSRWDLKGDQSISGKVRVQNVSIAPFIHLLPANKALQSRGGVIQAELLVELKGPQTQVSGDLHLLDVDIGESGQKQALISWKAGDIHRFSYQSSQSGGSSFTVDELLVSQPILRFEIDEKGFSNFRRLFASSEGAQLDGEAVAQPAVEKAAPQKSAFQYRVNTIKLSDGEMAFASLAMRPNLEVDVRRFKATLSGVSNAAGASAAIDVDGIVARSGSMRMKGQVSFDDPRRNNDVTLSFKNLPLNAFNPAVMTFAGHQITAGRLNLNLHYQAKEGELNGSNQIVIKKVELGEEVADFQGKKLPLGLAIALLEDSDDTIDLTINIAGNVDSPEFSASGLVWQAITNVLSNVASAPFRALAALLGMGADQGINALLGQAVYLPEDQDRLERFGDFLVKKPHASLELAGTYDPQQDKTALAQAIANTAILKGAGITIALNEAVPTLNLADPKTQAGLRSAYAQYVGRITLGQRLLTLPEGETRNERLHAELIASVPVGDLELKALAGKRAKLALDLMVKNNPGLRDQISLGEVRAIDAKKEGVPLEVEVRIK
ncbi:hypothetical protein TUM22923_05800 [Polynucleobacter sp. TUM22923]|uniref:DUF748 domain-containing protein n=1 Tax=Polynucleobacter sp. TUM22923 TaxID=3022126 RepID=UPI00257437B8|nr:DUF748 domain-containing protein [Polynucleobacter sp. TUM22923]BDX21259.1 hypothetical protein TUM22923_05800 [Polynucleobacter sp. TUM22923]